MQEPRTLAITDQGGPAQGHDAENAAVPILLVHGLMGRGRTWGRVTPWLRRYGRVFTFDAAWHQGRESDPPITSAGIATERFVADVAAVIEAIGRGPVVVIGHSMGGLHGWCLAAERPDLVRALVIEDMAPDFRGRTTQPWDGWFDSWPDEFPSGAEVFEMFGDVAGRYFLEAFDTVEGGRKRLHGHIDAWRSIAAHWGTRDYWDQWRAVRVPALLIEGEHTMTPAGQMREMASVPRESETKYLWVPGAAHLIHDEAPQTYRGAVEAFLAGL